MNLPALRVALDAYRSEDLAAMLKTAGFASLPSRKEDRVAEWARLIGDPPRIRREFEALAPQHRQALQLLQLHHGEMRIDRFRLLLRRAGLVGHGSGSQTNQSPEAPGTFMEVLTTLMLHGLILMHTLVVSPNPQLSWAGGRFVYIPREVAAHLPAAPQPAAAPEPEIQYALSGSARICQRDLYLLWSAAHDAPFQVVNTGLLRVSDLKRLAGALLVPEKIATGQKESGYRRILFLRRLAADLKLLHHTGFRIDADPQPAFFTRSAVERVRASFESWRDGVWWNELWATYRQGYTFAESTPAGPAPKGVTKARKQGLAALTHLVQASERSASGAEARVSGPRKLVAAVRARLGGENRQAGAQSPGSPDTDHGENIDDVGGPWITLDAIGDYLADHDAGFLVPQEPAIGDASHFALQYAGYRYNNLGWAWEDGLGEPAGWATVEQPFIQAVVAEGLFWLGLADLGYVTPVNPAGGSAPAGIVAIRLTDMGRWLLLGGPQPEVPEETGRVVLQPNFHIFAFDPISDSVLAQLDIFADRLHAERAVEYELTRDSVYRAQLAGKTVAEIQDWLAQVTGAALPQNVARSLDEWQAAYERITIRPHAGWLHVASSDLIDRLLSNPAAARATIARVGPQALLIKPGQVQIIENILLTMDQLPARVTDPARARRESIRVAADGQVSFVRALPDLYTCAALQSFASQEPDGSYRITPASVRLAQRQGLEMPQLLAKLEDLALGGIPAALRQKIKTWSGHFGAVTIRTVTLVEFRDEETLAEILADPQLGDYLRPFKRNSHLGLATVALADLPRVRALLVERGIELRDMV
jgi:hypothetical protein